MMTFHLYLAGMARELLLNNEKVNTIISRENSKLKENKRDQMKIMPEEEEKKKEEEEEMRRKRRGGGGREEEKKEKEKK